MLSTNRQDFTTGTDAAPWPPLPEQPISLDADRRRRVAQLDAMQQRDGIIVPPTLAMIELPIGPLTYSARLVDGPIKWGRRDCRGFCNADALDILIDARMPAELRRKVFFHELAHAWDFTFNVSDRHNRETIAELIGLGMATLSSQWFPTIERFLAAELRIGRTPAARAACIRTSTPKRRKAAAHE